MNKIKTNDNINIKIFFLDVDGVLTDGGLYFGEHGETLKRFNTLDGHGLKMLMRAGIVPAVVSGRDSLALRQRLSTLGLVHHRLGTEDKHPAAESILQELGYTWGQATAIGDDWPDLPMILPCAISFAPLHAHQEVRQRVTHPLKTPAGHGAVREACDILLQATGCYGALLKPYLSIQ